MPARDRNVANGKSEHQRLRESLWDEVSQDGESIPEWARLTIDDLRRPPTHQGIFEAGMPKLGRTKI